MKKILSILLVFAFVLGLSACSVISEDDKAKFEDLKDTISEIEEDLNKEIEENINETKEPFSYKMAKVYEKPYNEKDYNKTELVYVIEFNALGYHALDFAVFNKNGENIEETKSMDCDIRVYKGGICVDDNIEHISNTFLFGEKHKMQYTIVVTVEDDLYTFDDLTIKSKVYHRIDTKTKEDVTYEINADISEITTKQKYLHTDSLVNIDGVYYLFDENAGVGGNSIKSYHYVDIKPIENKVLDSLDGKIEWVDKDGKSIEIPDGCKMHFEFDGDEYNIGLESKDEQTALTEEQDELGNSGFLKYTDKAGFTTIFFAR